MQAVFQTRKLYSQTNSLEVKTFVSTLYSQKHPLTSYNQLESGAMHCSPLRLGLSPLAERLLRLSYHHWGEQCITRCYQIVDACTNLQITPQKFTWQANMAQVVNSIPTQLPKPLSSRNHSENSLYTSCTLHAHRSISNASHITRKLLFQKTNLQKTSVPENQSSENIRSRKYISRKQLQKIHLQKPKRINMKLNIPPV